VSVSSEVLYTGLVLLVAAVRLVELRVAAANLAWARAAGGVETGARHYPVMVAIHVGLLVGCVAEVWLLDRPFSRSWGAVALVALVAAHLLRWWCIHTLGRQWNTRVVVVPGMPLVAGGPYRWLRHPNYVAVVLEGIALPMVHMAWLTAVLFGIANAGVLTVRLRVEEAALRSAR